MKTLYFDCFNGISGDRVVSALLDLGIDRDIFAEQLNKLQLSGYSYTLKNLETHGVAALVFCVETEPEAESLPLSGFLSLIEKSNLSDSVKQKSRMVLERWRDAEERVQGTVSLVTKSMIDVVAACICIDLLAPDMILCSALADGHGSFAGASAEVPVPLPVVTQLLASGNGKMIEIDSPFALVTSAGAALVTELAKEFVPMPEMKLSSVGYGGEETDRGTTNILRVFWGEIKEEENVQDEVFVVQTSLEHTTGEVLGYVLDCLINAGALDAFFTPVFMQKNRPAYQLTVLCQQSAIETIRDIIFRETASFDLRFYRANRVYMQQETMKVSTEFGIADIQVGRFENIIKTSAEDKTAQQLAKDSGAPLRKVYEDIAEKTNQELSQW